MKFAGSNPSSFPTWRQVILMYSQPIMTRRFPGVDPFLEDPAFWRDFHERFARLSAGRQTPADAPSVAAG